MKFNNKGIITIGSLLVILFTIPFASSLLMKQQTAGMIYYSAEEVPTVNIAMVLGAAAYPARLSDILQDRMDTALELYEMEKVQKLLLTGAANEVEGMKAYALEKKVEENDIIEDPRGINTLASIQNANQISEMIIITQAFHLPRALFMARHFGIEAVGLTSDRRKYLKMFEFKKREILASTKAMLDLFVFVR